MNEQHFLKNYWTHRNFEQVTDWIIVDFSRYGYFLKQKWSGWAFSLVISNKDLNLGIYSVKVTPKDCPFCSGLLFFASIICATIIFCIVGIAFVIRILQRSSNASNSTRGQSGSKRVDSVFGTLHMEVISPNRRRKLKVPQIRITDEDGLSISKNSFWPEGEFIFPD